MVAEDCRAADGPAPLVRNVTLALVWTVAVAFAVVEAALLSQRPWGSDLRTYWSVHVDPSAYGLPPVVTGAWLYSPAAAQLFQPLGWLPWAVACLVWGAAAVAAYVWLLRPVGWVWGVPLFALTLDDLSAGQVTWLMALVCVVGLRHSAAWAVPTLMKVSLGVGVMWFVGRRDWRAVGIFVAAVAAVVAVSGLMAPGMWTAWVSFLIAHRDQDPTAFWRLLFAAALIVWAGAANRPWWVPVGLLLAVPVPAVYCLGLLCALPRLLPTDALDWMKAPRRGVGQVAPVTGQALQDEPTA